MPEIDRTVAVLGTGRALPERRVTNDELRSLVSGYDETSGDFSAWVDRVTHIQERRFSDTSRDGVLDLSLESGRKAIACAGLEPKDIDHVILCSFTYHDMYPGVHARLVPELGVSGGAFILTAACAGSLWGVSVARALVASGQCRNVLVIGAECIARVLNFQDPLTAILFADAAGAVVVGRKDDGADTGFLGRCVLKSDYSNDTIRMWNGSTPMNVELSARQTRTQDRPFIEMYGGPRVLRNAVNHMAESVVESLGYTLADLKADTPGLRELLSRMRLVPHQANGRIIDGLQEKLGLEREQVYRTVYLYGNSSAATNLVTYDYGVNEGNLWREPPPDGVDEMGRIVKLERKIEKGDLVVLTSIGAGYLYGAVAFVQAF